MAVVTSCFVSVLLLLLAVRVSDQCGSNFPTIKVLETDEPGHVLMNVTGESGVTWSLALSEDRDYPLGSELYRWLNQAIVIDDATVPGVLIFQLNYTLNLEYVYENWGQKLSVLSYYVTCSSVSGAPVRYEWFLDVQAVNEFAPEFVGAPFNVSLPEDAALNTVVIRLRDNATDKDVVTSGPSVHEFNMTIVPLPWSQNNSGLFSMADKQNGEVKVAQVLDFESFPEEAYMEFSITVWDLSRWNSTSTLTINILDVDDQPPYFYYPGCEPVPCEVIYNVRVDSTFTGVVTSLSPANITARDGDTLNYNITYHIRSVSDLTTSNFAKYVTIDQDSGEFSIVSLDGVASPQLYVIIRAVEVSAKALNKDTTLVVHITYPQQTTTATNTSTTTPGGSAGSGTTTSGLNTGFSRESESNSMVVAVVVLGVFVLLALVGLVVLVLYMKKRSDKPIYPANLKEIEEVEEEGGPQEKRGGGGVGGGVGTEGSRTDSGQWSMSGIPSPGPHAGSSAPSHTRLIPLGVGGHSQANGYLANGHSSAHSHGRRSQQQGNISHTTVAEEIRSEDEAQEDALEAGDSGRTGNGEVGSPSPVFTRSFVHTVDSPKTRAQRQGHTTRSHSTMGEDGGAEGEEEDGLGVMENGGPLVLQARRLPPLPAQPPPLAHNGATPIKRSRASRKQRREQSIDCISLGEEEWCD